MNKKFGLTVVAFILLGCSRNERAFKYVASKEFISIEFFYDTGVKVVKTVDDNDLYSEILYNAPGTGISQFEVKPMNFSNLKKQVTDLHPWDLSSDKIKAEIIEAVKKNGAFSSVDSPAITVRIGLDDRNLVVETKGIEDTAAFYHDREDLRKCADLVILIRSYITGGK